MITDKDLNVVVVVKRHERYVFLYTDDRAEETCRTLGRFASDPDLSFTWYDAAIAAEKVRTDMASKIWRIARWLSRK